MATPLTLTWKTNTNIKSKIMFVTSLATVVYRGVFVSFNPRKTPCMANDRRTAGAPSDLRVKYSYVEVSIRELEWTPMKFNIGFAPKVRNMTWMRPRIPPMTSAVKADGICLLCSNFGMS